MLRALALLSIFEQEWLCFPLGAAGRMWYHSHSRLDYGLSNSTAGSAVLQAVLGVVGDDLRLSLTVDMPRVDHLRVRVLLKLRCSRHRGLLLMRGGGIRATARDPSFVIGARDGLDRSLCADCIPPTALRATFCLPGSGALLGLGAGHRGRLLLVFHLGVNRAAISTV